MDGVTDGRIYWLAEVETGCDLGGHAAMWFDIGGMVEDKQGNRSNELTVGRFWIYQ